MHAGMPRLPPHKRPAQRAGAYLMPSSTQSTPRCSLGPCLRCTMRAHAAQVYAQQPHARAAAPAGPQGEGAPAVRPDADGSDIAARMAAASAPVPPAPAAPCGGAGPFWPGPGPSAAAVPWPPGGRTGGPAPARSAAPRAEADHPAVPCVGAARRSSRGAGPEAAAQAHGAAEAHAPAGAGLGAADVDASDAQAPRHAEGERDPGAGGPPAAAGRRPGELAASPAGPGEAGASSAGAGGRQSPDAVLAWADAWEHPPLDGAGRGSAWGQGHDADDGDGLGASAWRERLGGLMASGGGLLASADSGRAPGAECASALHNVAYSGAQAPLQLACKCVAHTEPPPAVRGRRGWASTARTGRTLQSCERGK